MFGQTNLGRGSLRTCFVSDEPSPLRRYQVQRCGVLSRDPMPPSQTFVDTTHERQTKVHANVVIHTEGMVGYIRAEGTEVIGDVAGSVVG